MTLIGIVIKRLYGSIDVLFKKVDELQRQVNSLKLIVLRTDPESSVVFRVLSNGDE